MTKQTKKNLVVVLPTYNEKDNILILIGRIFQQAKKMPGIRLTVLVVDDHSPDGTGMLVKHYTHFNPDTHLLSGEKEGLGAAYVRGITYALSALRADIVLQMDADFSHDPNDIPRLVRETERGDKVIAIGSRYVMGGSIPRDWPIIRVLISKIGNFVARRIAGIGSVADCTSGFRAMDSRLLSLIDLTRIGARGYAFQMNLLHAALAKGARVVEAPIHFFDRASGASKMRLTDIIEFIINALALRFRPSFTALSKLKKYRREIGFGSFAAVVAIFGSLFLYEIITLQQIGLAAFLFISLLITVQAMFTLFGMMYAWDEPKRIDKNRSPEDFVNAQYSFTAIIPALHEDRVIGDTIRAAAAIEYPDKLKEILVICRADDTLTIAAARQAIQNLKADNIFLLIPPFTPKNKPAKLNFALQHASKDIVCVFDAEDAPHRELFNVVNTVLVRDDADVVQSGVQLVNFRSKWFSTLNVLEYFFWFKSVLQYFAQKHVLPLGGNTVFFKRYWLEKVRGWDENCLTEDADVGIALSSAGAKIRIIYDETHATQEETPPSLWSFIKQRTRWNQGFIQVYKKQEWKRLPRFSQRLLVAYILIWPEIQAFLFLYVALSVVMMFTVKLPIVITLVSLLPLYLLIVHLIVLNVGLYEFTKKYAMPFPFWMPIKVTLTFIPFQFLLGLSAVRAVYRELTDERGWEKTDHINAHRPAPDAVRQSLRSSL